MLKLIENGRDVYSFEIPETYIQINTVEDINELSNVFKVELYKD